ncbi:MAG: HNH endonuclease [Trebonia sp.]
MKFKHGPAKQLRLRLYQKANYMCAHCQRRVTPPAGHDPMTAVSGLEIDHIVSLARGGSNDPSNLQVLCEHCNKRKGHRLQVPA